MKSSTGKISRLLSLVLRHKPESIGLHIDSNGWAKVDELLKKANIDMETLEDVVATNNKKRFAFNDDKTKIRANQGHSIKVDLELESLKPPNYLYHGTSTRFLKSIYEQGLVAGRRQQVHLSSNSETALNVGSRHGKPIILVIDTKSMFADGYKFYLSQNNVWLTDYVPAKYFCSLSGAKSDE